MKRLLICILALFSPLAAFASSGTSEMLKQVVQDHILPGYQNLATTTENLAQTAAHNCAPQSADLNAAYHTAFDAWISVSHLRFGPAQLDNRAYAMAFWPDKKGFGAKKLRAMIRDNDPVVSDPQAYRKASIAVQGFMALELLMFDDAFAPETDAERDYTCQLINAITADIATMSRDILSEWENEYSTILQTAGSPDNPIYLSSDEGVQEVFKALMTGLEFTMGTRLARPLGSFERPRPKRAEAWRSDRSQRHVLLSLEAVRQLAPIIAAYQPDAELAGRISRKLGNAADLAAQLDDPIFAGVSEPASRVRIEALQSSIQEAYMLTANELAPALGIQMGFNSLDGD